MAPSIISIEGNIGSGKSTLVDMLQTHFEDNSRICFLQEPISVWNTIKDTNGATILEKYYADQTKYAFSFQMMAYISRLSLLREALKGDYDIIVTERSVYTDSMVFAKMLYDDKKIEEIEYMIYKKWFDEFLDDLPEIRLVYVKTDPKIASRRVEKRAREGETIPLSYLENCHKYHEDWLTNHESSRLLVLDADADITELPSVAVSWIRDIGNFMLPDPTPPDVCLESRADIFSNGKTTEPVSSCAVSTDEATARDPAWVS